MQAEPHSPLDGHGHKPGHGHAPPGEQRTSQARELERVIPPLLVGVGGPLNVLFFAFDCTLLGPRLDFLGLRLIYGPGMWALCRAFDRHPRLRQLWPTGPVWATTSYFAFLLAYGAHLTGALDSGYCAGLAQVLLGIALLPIGFGTYLGVVLFMWAVYLGGNAHLWRMDYLSSWNQLSTSLLNMAICLTLHLFSLHNWMRRISLQNQLADALLQQSAIIDSQSVQLKDAAEHARYSAKAREAAHDIRSPLAALSVAERRIATAPAEATELLRAGIVRIEGIAESMLSYCDEPEPEPALGPSPPLSHLLAAVSKAIAAKRLAWEGRPSLRLVGPEDPPAFGLFVLCEAMELERAVSKLLDEAAEACTPETAQLTVRLVQEGRSGEGRGDHIQLTAEAAPAARPGPHAALPLKLAPVPGWFAQDLRVPRAATVLVLDEDLGIHALWRARLRAAQQGPQVRAVHCFREQEALRDWIARVPHKSESLLLLTDHPLGASPITGTMVVESLGLQAQAVLVTHAHDNPQVQRLCQQLGLRLLPKIAAAYVPLRLDVVRR